MKANSTLLFAMVAAGVLSFSPAFARHGADDQVRENHAVPEPKEHAMPEAKEHAVPEPKEHARQEGHHRHGGRQNDDPKPHR
jgi:hypothetical protein